jgi:hypothetical protein
VERVIDNLFNIACTSSKFYVCSLITLAVSGLVHGPNKYKILDYILVYHYEAAFASEEK